MLVLNHAGIIAGKNRRYKRIEKSFSIRQSNNPLVQAIHCACNWQLGSQLGSGTGNTVFCCMLLEKIPYHLIGVDIPAGLANDPCRQILMASRPGVSATFHGIKNDLRSPFLPSFMDVNSSQMPLSYTGKLTREISGGCKPSAGVICYAFLYHKSYGATFSQANKCLLRSI